jgi:hypothetical protein
MRSTADGLRRAGDHILAGPFGSHSAAWRWVDRHSGSPISRSEHVAEWIWNKSSSADAERTLLTLLRPGSHANRFLRRLCAVRGGAPCAPLMRRVSSGDLPPPSPPGEKTTARKDQAGQSGTGAGTARQCCRCRRPNRGALLRGLQQCFWAAVAVPTKMALVSGRNCAAREKTFVTAIVFPCSDDVGGASSSEKAPSCVVFFAPSGSHHVRAGI